MIINTISDPCSVDINKIIMHFQIAYMLMPPWVSSVLHEMDFFILLKQNWVQEKGENYKVWGKHENCKEWTRSKQNAVKDDGGCWSWWILIFFSELAYKYEYQSSTFRLNSNILDTLILNFKFKFEWKDLYSFLIEYFKYDDVISFAWIIPLFFSVQRRPYLPLILFVFHILNAIVISYSAIEYK